MGFSSKTAEVAATLNLFEYQLPKSQKHIGRMSEFSDYRWQRVEKLRELYEEMEPEYHRICTYVDHVDGRRNAHELWEVEEGISPFDLPNFEELMPDITEFDKNEPDS
tara:strand:- start:4710 stop:5033 length:324 start_codon:yes stop_codon:yes gene_type:complete